jgi:large conductance mechanosensitive channel
MRRVLEDFRAFALRGNVLDLAVAVILGLAFNAVVQSLVDDILMNLIAAVFGEPDFSELQVTVGEAAILYGQFLNALVNFVLVALALFVAVKAFNRARELRGHQVEPPTTRECPYCITNIPIKAQRCSACTSEVQAVA